MRQLTLVLLTAAVASAAPGSKDEWAAEYQKKADAAAWDWADERATADYSARQCPVPAAVSLTSVTLTVGDKTVSFDGHPGTTFAVTGKTLYYADYGPHSTGCVVVAVDLDTGKRLWKVHLKGLGPIEHFKYHNQVALDADDRAVRVIGNESQGRYIEYLDQKTGRTIGHKVFPKD